MIHAWVSLYITINFNNISIIQTKNKISIRDVKLTD